MESPLAQVHPALGGIGYGSTVVAGLVGCYYNVIISWCIYYLWSSINVSLKCFAVKLLENQFLPKGYVKSWALSFVSA